MHLQVLIQIMIEARIQLRDSVNFTFTSFHHGIEVLSVASMYYIMFLNVNLSNDTITILLPRQQHGKQTMPQKKNENLF